MRQGAVLLKHKKSSPDNQLCLAVASEQESCRDSMPSRRNPIVTNPVLCKNLEHPLLTR